MSFAHAHHTCCTYVNIALTSSKNRNILRIYLQSIIQYNGSNKICTIFSRGVCVVVIADGYRGVRRWLRRWQWPAVKRPHHHHREERVFEVKRWQLRWPSFVVRRWWRFFAIYPISTAIVKIDARYNGDRECAKTNSNRWKINTREQLCTFIVLFEGSDSWFTLWRGDGGAYLERIAKNWTVQIYLSLLRIIF